MFVVAGFRIGVCAEQGHWAEAMFGLNCHKSIFDDLLFHPHETFFNEKFEEEGVKIAEKMNVKDQFEDEKCIKCHGIEVASDYPKVTEEEKGLFGIVCETCHNPAQDWVEIHDKRAKFPKR